MPIVVCVGACTPFAVTPPPRAFVIDSPSTPPAGRSDVQLDAAAIGEVFGPNLVGGNARLRHTVEPGVSVEADAGVLHVNNGSEAIDRNGYTGRLGVLLRSEGRHAAFGAGVGGGLSPTAGSWGSADVHGAVSGAHRYVRPLLGAGVGYSAPFGHKTFFVHDQDVTLLRLPHNVFAQAELGLELGPPDKAFILGMSLLHFWLKEDSHVGGPPGPLERDFAAIGIGLRIAID